MPLSQIKQLPTAEQLRELYPLPSAHAQLKAERDAQLARIVEGRDKRLMVVIGPCSADDADAVTEYVARLAAVQEKLKDALFIIPRIYVSKPRSAGVGYQGLLYHPDPMGEADICEGIVRARKLYLRVLSETGMAAANELDCGVNIGYFSDLLSYHAIGARSTEDQAHRQIASGIDVPVGFKNPMSGDIGVMLNSINAAQQSHRFAYDRAEVSTSGNPYAHAILRGFSDTHRFGSTTETRPNYHCEDLLFLIESYHKAQLKNPMIVVDASHGNSRKRYLEQPRIVKEILFNRSLDPMIRSYVRGVMIESYLEEGARSATDYVYGKSITDPCLGWEDSERLLFYIAENI